MLVRTLKAHANGYGESYFKAVGDEYEHSSPNGLIKRKRVEAADGSAGGQGDGLQGTGKGAGGTAKGDGAKHVAAGAKKGRAANPRRRAAKRAGANRGA